MVGKIIGFSLLGLFVALLLFMLLRTLLTKKPNIDNASYTPRDIDLDRVRDHLIGAVQIPTAISREEQHLQRELEQALLAGGDISNVLKRYQHGD